MKNIITALLMMISVSAFSQSSNLSWYPAVDTLTNADTLTFTWGDVLWEQGSLELHAVADSLTGTTAATLFVETSTAPSGLQWIPVDTTSISGSQTITTFEDLNFSASRVRVRVISTGTQSTKVQVGALFKKTRY